MCAFDLHPTRFQLRKFFDQPRDLTAASPMLPPSGGVRQARDLAVLPVKASSRSGAAGTCICFDIPAYPFLNSRGWSGTALKRRTSRLDAYYQWVTRIR